MMHYCLVLLVVTLLSALVSTRAHGATVSSRQAAGAGVEYLRRVMDQYHAQFIVYEDVSAPGNHFHAWAKLPNELAAVACAGSDTTNPHSGATAIRCTFQNTSGSNFGGFYFLNGILPPGIGTPQPNFGTVPDAGISLTGATALTFWVRGERGGEKVEFFMGGVGRDASTGVPTMPFPDSTPRRPRPGTVFTLTTQWQKITIDLTGLDLRYILGGFGWVASAGQNPNGAVFYLDDIQYELDPARRAQRLEEPRFLRSFTTLPVQPNPFDANKADDIDFVLRNTAYTYDNAVALLAFLADGSADSLRRARLIGDAFVYASHHDRTFDDGRLRSDYAAGDIALPPGWTPNGRSGTVPIPGFFDEARQEFIEVEQGAVDTGNNAWAMIGLLALYRRTQEPTYLSTARTLGQFIRTFRNDTGTYQGFQGGVDDPESATPRRRIFASVEHNLDVFAAFTVMFQITKEPQWQTDAQHARQFVEAMWDASRGCYLAGTSDPSTRNTVVGQLPEDAQAWSVLALTDALTVHSQALECAEHNHRTIRDGFSGFDFNEDRDGVWFEGTAHMAVAYAMAHQDGPAEALRQQLMSAQHTAPFGDDFGLAAGSHDGISTGFGFSLFRRLHVGATAWNVFAQLRFNPYYATPVSHEPSLTLTLNQTAVHTGDQLALTALATPGLTPVMADVYIALQPPGCTSFACILFWQGGVVFTATPQPILRNWTISPFSGPIFSYTFGGTEPVGTYVWLGAFVLPGTETLIGGIAQALFTFSP